MYPAEGLLYLLITRSYDGLLRCRWTRQQKKMRLPQEMRMSAQPQNFSAGMDRSPI